MYYVISKIIFTPIPVPLIYVNVRSFLGVLWGCAQSNVVYLL